MGNLNDGLGRHSEGFRPFTFLAPNKTFDQKLDIEVAGIKLELIRVPSETKFLCGILKNESWSYLNGS
jgi:hypothetical protein